MRSLFIVDDDEDILFTLKYWFSKKEYAVKTFNNSRALYEALKEAEPDLLLLDVLLNREDGRQICMHLKNEMHYNFPIILFSANQALSNTFSEFLADDFIEKPFDLKSMGVVVNLHIRA